MLRVLKEGVNNYNKNKNKILLLLIIKFKSHNRINTKDRLIIIPSAFFTNKNFLPITSLPPDALFCNDDYFNGDSALHKFKVGSYKSKNAIK